MVRPPILSLPEELVLEVMKDVDRPLKLSAVCSSWRRSALRYPPLWTTIRVHDLNVFTAVPHAQTFAARAMSLPLKVHRTGIDNDADRIALDIPLRVLDGLLFALFKRFIAFEYTSFVPDGRFTRFVVALFSYPAPILRSFHLHDARKEIVLPKIVPMLDLGTNWPMLRDFRLTGVCMPLHRLHLANLESLYIWIPDECHEQTSHCQLHPDFAHHVIPIVRASPKLRELTVAYEIGMEGGSDALRPADCVRIDEFCKATLRQLHLYGTPVIYPTSSNTLRSPPQLRNLTSLSLLGDITCPGHGRPVLSAVASFLWVLTGAPNLEDLDINEWTEPIYVEDPAALPKVHLGRLTSVLFRDCTPEWCQYIVACLVAPVLRSLILEVLYHNAFNDRRCALFTPTDWKPWAFPSVQSLQIEVIVIALDFNPGPASSFELEQLLRGGVWSNLEELTIRGHGWLCENALEVVIDALCDRNVAPRLRVLRIKRCSFIGGNGYNPPPPKPGRVYRSDVDAAMRLLAMRRDSSTPNIPRLSIEFGRCQHCDWPESAPS
ncbi:hypothetical protein EXIGLDRAFT_734830 [Exidia glandulosa HHB12029]|uniref:Uncharacterized protein n=1 Tax=Exidia glandulosa HHB12029 TaxID=1314781 RepID=A0A165AZC4_EXIGL|nr:hypothetical protein EXIGLDRAFT_734830 [Exidia glandulosa HHB12029]